MMFSKDDVIGGYRIIRKIGAGAMGAVYEVEHEFLHQRFALKTITALEDNDQDNSVERFFQEARVMAQLSHPGIVSIQTLEINQATGQPYFVMEYVAMPAVRREELLKTAVTSGNKWFRTSATSSQDLKSLSLEDLYQYAKKTKTRINPEVVRQICIDVCSALHYAHTFGHGILHRDIKPANILIRENGHAVIADFGVAKVKDQAIRKYVLQQRARSLSLRVDRDGAAYHLILGTREYMAPELLSGDPPSVQTELYALGVTAYQLLTGEMFSSGAMPPSEFGCDPLWDEVLHKCLRANPAERWESVAALGEALQRMPARIRKRKVKRIAGISALSALALAGLGFLFGPLMEKVSEFYLGKQTHGIVFPETNPLACLEIETIVNSDGTSCKLLKRVHPDARGVLDLRSVSFDRIDPNAFSDCPYLTDVLLPEGNFSKPQLHAYLKTVPCDGGVRIIGATLPKACSVLSIPETIDGLPVREIGVRAFESDKQIQEVFLPKNLRTIKERAFRLAKVQRVYFAPGLQNIETSAFVASRLQFADLPNTMNILEEYAFGLTQVKRIRLSEGIAFIGDDVGFDDCEGELIFPKTITTAPIKCLPKLENGISVTFLGVREVPESAFKMNKLEDCSCHELNFEQPLVHFAQKSLEVSDLTTVNLHFPAGGKVDFDEGAVVSKSANVNVYFGGKLERCWDGEKWVFAKEIAPIERLETGLLVQKWGKEYVVKGFARGVVPPKRLVIPETHKGMPMVTIGRQAFAENKQLEQVVLPKTIKRILAGAFMFSSVQQVEFSEGLLEIGDGAFGMSALQSALLPDSLEMLGQSVFEESQIKQITFPKNLKLSGSRWILNNCNFNGANLVFNTQMDVLSQDVFGLFRGAEGIASIRFPNITRVTKDAFIRIVDVGKINLYFEQKEVVFEKGALDAPVSFAEDSINAVALHFPKGAKPVFKDGVFTKYTYYVEVHIEGEPVRYWNSHEQAWTSGEFLVKTWETKELEDGTLKIEKCNLLKTVTKIVVPDRIGGRRVSTLGGHLFDGFSDATSIILPETITRIENACFIRMENLEEIMLPSSFKMDDFNVGLWMFQWCKNLRKVVFLSAPKYFPHALFDHCPALEKVEIPGTVLPKIAGSNTFDEVPKSFRLELTGDGSRYRYACMNNRYTLISEELAESAEQLANGILVRKRNMDYVITGFAEGVMPPKRLVIPEEYKGLPIVEIGASAFEQNKQLEQVVLPKTIRKIAAMAFKDSSVQQVEFQDGLLEIDDEAFHASDLQAVLLPNSVEKLGESVFQNSKIKQIAFPKNLKACGGRILTGCRFDHAKLDFDTQVTTLSTGSINYGLFWYSSGIASLHFPNVKQIKKGALHGIGGSAAGDKIDLYFGQKEVCFESGSLTAGDAKGRVVAIHFPKGAEPVFESHVFTDKTHIVEIHVEGEPVRHWNPRQQAWESGEFVPKTWETKQLENGTLKIENCNLPKTVTEIVVPEQIDGRKVSTLAVGALGDFKAVRSLTLPETITCIENACFIRMENLEEITLPRSLKMDSSNVGRWMFQWCKHLKKVVFLSAPTYFPLALFSHCPALEKVEIPGTELPKIEGDYTFEEVPESFRLELKGSGALYRYEQNGNAYTLVLDEQGTSAAESTNLK